MLTPRERERRRIIRKAKRILEEIEIDFNTAAYWNENIRKPDEALIDFDPDGTIRRLADGLRAMLADDAGEGPIPPIGGWMSPLFGRKSTEKH